MVWKAWKLRRLIQTARAASHWPPEKLRRAQEDRLRVLLRHAYDAVPLYRRLYDEAGFHPRAFRSLADLERVPRLTKQALKRARPDEFLARGVAASRCRVIPTSGSTGAPLQVYLTPADDLWQRAVAWRILFEHGFRYTDRTLEIRMSPGESFAVQRLGVAPKDWASILDPPESWARSLARHGHEVVVACASSLQALAAAVEARGLAIRPPRIVVSDSEVLTAAAGRRVEQALGTAPVDVFGLVEVSNFAWQCERREGFHLSADSHIVEVSARPGEAGEMVVTALGMWGMPIIRYETGDLAELHPEPCRCGRTLPRLAQVSGRVADAVVLPDGQRLYWPYFHEILSAYPDIEQWQVVQEQAHRVRVHLVAQGAPDGLLERLRVDLRTALPAEFGLVLDRCDEIHREPRDKARVIVSRLHPAAGVGP